jgi:hypothetical protein
MAALPGSYWRLRLYNYTSALRQILDIPANPDLEIDINPRSFESIAREKPEQIVLGIVSRFTKTIFEGFEIRPCRHLRHNSGSWDINRSFQADPGIPFGREGRRCRQRERVLAEQSGEQEKAFHVSAFVTVDRSDLVEYRSEGDRGVIEFD